MDEERQGLIVIGRRLGTYNGWDQGDEQSYVYYEFEPTEGVNLPAGDLYVDFGSGLFNNVNAEGQSVPGVDMIGILLPLNRVEE